MTNATKNSLSAFSKNIEKLWANAEIPYPVHISGGNEEPLIEIFKNINPSDYVFSTHRSHYHYLLKGGSEEKLLDMIKTGKSMHVFDKSLNFLAASIVSGMPAIACGTALALKKQKSPHKVYCFVGDGAEDEGHFYEAVRYVDGWELPCTFIIEDNDRSVETPKAVRYGKSVINWPPCVQRYDYTPAYPHVGVSAWVNFPPRQDESGHASPWDLTGQNAGSAAPGFKGTYKEALDKAMLDLAQDPRRIFIGYNVTYGSKAYGTLQHINKEQIIEMPVAENLMMGLAIGLSIGGYKPVVFFERHDFILNALDAIVNHLDKIEMMSEGEFKTPVIIRAAVGSQRPLDPGPQHLGNYTDAFRKLIRYFPIHELHDAQEVITHYAQAGQSDQPVMLVEYRENYGQTVKFM